MTALQLIPPEALIATGALFGCLIGSFLNVVAHRLPQMAVADMEGRDAGLSLAFPASHCPKCAASLSWRENIPLVSFVLQRGRCQHCHAPIAWRYPLLEALGAVWRLGFGPEGAFAAAALLALLALAAIDLETGLLPDRLTLPLLWAGLGLAAVGFGPAPEAAILGAGAGYLALEGLNGLCRLAIGRDGLGGGDAKLAAALGAWVGAAALPAALLIAFTAGAVYGLSGRVLFKERPAEELPFGPWLAVGGAILLLWPTIADAFAVWLTLGRY